MVSWLGRSRCLASHWWIPSEQVLGPGTEFQLDAAAAQGYSLLTQLLRTLVAWSRSGRGGEEAVTKA